MYVHHVDGDEDVDEDTENSNVNYFQFQESTRLSVVRCTLTQPKVSDDCRRNTIFYTFTKIENEIIT